MKEYLVFVESSDYFTVEAEDRDAAEAKAKEIAWSCSTSAEWKATILNEKDTHD